MTEDRCRCCGRTETPEGEPLVHAAYGGWVCSQRCDEAVAVRVEGSMPGCRRALHPQPATKQAIDDRWSRYRAALRYRGQR